VKKNICVITTSTDCQESIYYVIILNGGEIMTQDKSSEDLSESSFGNDSEVVDTKKEEFTEKERKLLSKYDGIMFIIGIFIVLSIFNQFSFAGGEVFLSFMLLITVCFIIMGLIAEKSKSLKKLQELLAKREAIEQANKKNQQ
jgi:membrane protein insertase Oxa1/YidC/SpoIIIJ